MWNLTIIASTCSGSVPEVSRRCPGGAKHETKINSWKTCTEVSKQTFQTPLPFCFHSNHNLKQFQSILQLPCDSSLSQMQTCVQQHPHNTINVTKKHQVTQQTPTLFLAYVPFSLLQNAPHVHACLDWRIQVRSQSESLLELLLEGLLSKDPALAASTSIIQLSACTIYCRGAFVQYVVYILQRFPSAAWPIPI